MKQQTYNHYRAFIKNHSDKGRLRTLSSKQKNIDVDFSQNDSLLLSKHPAVIDALCTNAKKYGVGICGARLLCDKQALYSNVEHKIAQLKQTQTALLFASGFQANVAAISAILDKQVLKCEPIVIADKLVHASIHQGIKLAGCREIRFNHQDLNHLEARLASIKDHNTPKFVFVESLYGMEGTITDLKSLSQICYDYDAFLYVDEAHAFGLYGQYGGGLTAQYPGVDMSMGNFSKALGSFGGFIACSNDIKQYLINHAQGFIYSTALGPPILGAQTAALDLITQMTSQRAHLANLASYLKQQLVKYQIPHTNTRSHIVGILFDSQTEAKEVYENCLQNRVGVSLIRPPTVPQTRLRICLNINHSTTQIDKLINCLTTL